jgi:hypothetical protein
MAELKYIIEKDGEVLENKIINNPNLYPFLTNNLRNQISSDILTRDLFWKTQNIIKLFPFLLEESQKN